MANSDPTPRSGDRLRPRESGKWDDTDRARWIAARVDSDHKKIGVVAEEMGLDPALVATLLARGRAMRPNFREPKQVVTDGANETHVERRDRFIRAMRRVELEGITLAEALKE